MLNRTISPEISDFPSLRLPAFEESILPNGARLLILNSGDEAVTRTAILWRAGLVDIPVPAPLTLMAAMLSEGCGELSGKEVTDILESNGAWLKCNTTHHSLLLTLHCLNHTAQDIFPLLGQIIAAPTFPADTLESLKNKCAAEKEIASRKPSYQASILSRQTRYGESHPLASYISPQDILNVERNSLVAYHQGIMLSNTPTIFISGKVTPDIKELISTILGSIPFNISSENRIKQILHQIPPFTSSKTVYKELPDSLQSAVRIQIPTINRNNPEYDSLRFVTVALGGYFGSRLMSNIREDKGYTYGISANLTSTLEDGNVIISCECDNKYANAVVDEINKEIKRIATEEMPEEELLTVRNVLVSALAGVLDSPFNISGYRELIESYNIPPETFANHFHTVMTMTSAKVMEMTNKYLLNQPAVIAIAGGQPG